MPIQMKGVRELKRILKNAEPKIRLVVMREVNSIANEVANESRSLVPFDEGILSGSMTVTANYGPTDMTATIAYGGPAAPYALVQHEGIDPRTGKPYFHPAKAKGGTSPGIPGETRAAKFLEKPVERHQPTVVPRLLKAIKKVT